MFLPIIVMYLYVFTVGPYTYEVQCITFYILTAAHNNVTVN
jgi:hypothetical protein